MKKRCIIVVIAYMLTLLLMHTTTRAESKTSEWQYIINEDGTVTVTGYNGMQTEVLFPTILDERTVTSIALEDFYLNEVYSVIIPDGVIEIKSLSFAECDLLEEIDLPSSLISIGDSCFVLSGIQRLELPEGLVYLGYEVFAGSAIEMISLPSTLHYLDRNPFVRCERLTDISISPDNPYYFTNGGVLYESSDARLICFPNGLRNGHCEIPDGTRIIGREAFAYTNHPFEVVLPEGVIELEYYAFSYCSYMDIWLPESISNIDDFAFYDQGIGPGPYLHIVPGSYAESFCIEHGLNYDYQPAD